MRLLPTIFITCLAASATADVRVIFGGGVPMDRFFIANTGTCPLGSFSLTIDLTGSPSNLFFDVTTDATGMDSFQPVEIVSGIDEAIAADETLEGDNRMKLRMSGLPAGGVVGFNIDVDDTISTSVITVSGAEIAGATITLNVDGQASSGIFNANGQATAETMACAS